MKRLFLLLTLLSVFPLLVKAGTASKDCGAVTTCTLTIPTVSVGDLTVVVVRAGKTPTISITGFQSAGHIDSSDPHRLEIFYQISTVSGSVNVIVNAAGASTLRLAGSSFTGPWDSAAPSFVGATGNSRNASSGACPSTVLCVGGVSSANPQTATVVSGESLLASAASKVFLLSGIATSNVSLSGTDLWAAVAVGFSRPATTPPPAISVSISPSSATVSTNGLQVLTANVTNDPSNAGVVWSQTGVGSTLSTSVTAATYLAPSSAGTAVVTATSVTDPTKAVSVPVTVVVPQDTTPPVVSVSSPAASQSISGVVSIDITATDNVGVSSVQVLVDGSVFGSPLTSSPYILSLDTVGLAPGTHTISATSVDAAGNIGTASAITVTVAGEVFDITLLFDDGTPYNAGGTVSFSEMIPNTNNTQSDITAKVSPTGNFRVRWPATPGVVYIVVVQDVTNNILWQTGTELTPTQVPVAFLGVTTVIQFSKVTGFWAGFSKFNINY